MKSKEAKVAEPEMVYGRGRAMQGCLMQYIVPEKDRSFLEDIAKVRGWKSFENQVDIEQPTVRRRATDKKKENPPKVCCSRRAFVPTKKKLSRLEESIQQVERGEVFSADSVDDMFDQILGKGWRTK